MTTAELIERLKEVAYKVIERDSYNIDRITDLFIYTSEEDFKENDMYIRADLYGLEIELGIDKYLSLNDKPIIDLIFKYFEA